MDAVYVLFSLGKGGRSIAVTIMPIRTTATRQSWQLFTCIALTLCAAAGLLLTPGGTPRWASLLLIPVTGWLSFAWVRNTARIRERLCIGNRLSRLPDDFYLLHDLRIPSPWGETQIDEVIISRFGLVAIGAGSAPGRMPERVEAIRTLLFTYGIAQPSLPVRPLILLPPGAPPPRQVQYGVPTLRVEHLRLHHLAPSSEAVLSDEQAATIAQCLLQARAAG